MYHILFWLLFVSYLLALAASLPAASDCPKGCTCSKPPSTVTCHGLDSVPTNFSFDVKKLFLNNKNKIKSIPENTFAYCTHCASIEELWMNNNQLERLENGSLRGLTALSKAMFTHNKLTAVDVGAFDGAFERADAEVSIDFTQNQLTALPPLLLPCKQGHMPKTIHLTFQDNKLSTAAVPPIWTNSCTDLQLKELGLSANPIMSISATDFLPLKDVQSFSKLSLARTQLTSISSEAYTNLPFIQTLDLSDNPLNESQLYNLFLGLNGRTSLKTLRLNKLGINGPPVGSNKTILNSTFFAPLNGTSLETLEMTHNQIVLLDDAATFQILNKLENLFLQNSNLHRMHPDILKDSSQLIRLRLSNNSLIRAPVAHSAGLQELTLDRNQLSGTFKIGLITGKSVPKLKSLNLSYNRFNGLDEGAFAGDMLPSLVALDLSHNAIEKLDSDARVFEPLKATLESLDFSYQSPPLHVLTSALFSSLQLLRNLSLTNNNLMLLPSGLFGGLSSLEMLFMQNNNISTWDAGLFAGSNNLTTLDMSNNAIETLSSAQFSQLPASLKEWRLTGNQWRCDCDLLPFREWLPTARVQVPGWPEFRCANAPFSNLTFANFSHSSLNCTTQSTTVIPQSTTVHPHNTTEHTHAHPPNAFISFVFALCVFLLAVVCASCAVYFIYVWPVRRTIDELRRYRGEYASVPVSNRLSLQAASSGGGGSGSRLNLLNEDATDEQHQQQAEQQPQAPVPVVLPGSARIPRALVFYTLLDCPRELLDSITAIITDPSVGCVVDTDVVTEIHHQPNVSRVALMDVIGRRDLAVFVYTSASAGDALFKRCLSVCYELSRELSGFPLPIVVRAPLSPRPRALSFPQRFYAEWEDGAIQVPSRDSDAVSIAESVHEGQPQGGDASGGSQLSSAWREQLRVRALERLRFTTDARDVPAPEAV